MATKQQLNQAFKDLRKLGYFARQNFWCCQSCGCAAIPEKFNSKYVFYHRQDTDDLNYGGSCYLSWGRDGDGHEIVDVLRKNNVLSSWSGYEHERILIKGIES